MSICTWKWVLVTMTIPTFYILPEAVLSEHNYIVRDGRQNLLTKMHSKANMGLQQSELGKLYWDPLMLRLYRKRTL